MKRKTVKCKPALGKRANPRKKRVISREREAQRKITERMIGTIL